MKSLRLGPRRNKGKQERKILVEFGCLSYHTVRDITGVKRRCLIIEKLKETIFVARAIPSYHPLP
jgi:hypothetical protein